MSKLWVSVDYNTASTIIKGLRAWLDKLEQMLDEANVDNKKSEELNKRKDRPDNGAWP